MISIVIPVLNESAHLPCLLTHLKNNVGRVLAVEVLVVDGGSSDDTVAIAQQFAIANRIALKIISSQRGRAKQMNAGAQVAQGDILYFLHADSFPPKHFDVLIEKEVANGNPAGCFKMQFDSTHWWLKLASWFTKFSWRACRGGDQSQFITRQLFDEIGGFDERYIIYEDNMLINELYARNSFVVIQEPIQSSARLYEKYGVWYVQYHFWAIYVKKWFGASAEELLAYYCNHLKKPVS